MKHIYLHTSNVEYWRDFNNDPSIEKCFEYDPFGIEKSHQYEYGRIKTKQNYYHFLVGKIKQKDCPWCGSFCTVKRINELEVRGFSRYCMECENCGARGPILNVNLHAEQDEKHMGWFTDLIRDRFETRRHWDSDFVNHYEQPKATS